MSETAKKTFGKYEAISHLGSGAMGVVWRAQDPVLGRTVAVKTISAALGSDSENKERFLREARAAAQLNHPNIITVFDFGQADNELYMAMELLEGKDLKELISLAQLTFDQKLDIMEQVADGLAYAHGREVIHRDLKPGNIHVQPNGQVKILDFGLARLGSSDLTKTGVVMGTPNYMSPEQVMGERVDPRSDVFSAGAVFYELLTNRKPFDAESVHATLYQVVHREAPPPRQWDPRLPDGIVSVIEIAMSKQVDGRYRDAGALRDAIRAFRYGEEPEVVEFEEGGADAPQAPAAADATAVKTAPSPSSSSGTAKVSPFRSYGRSGSVPPTAGVSSAPYTTGRIIRPGSKPPSRTPATGLPSSSASIPPPPQSTNIILVVGVVGLLAIVAFLGYGILNRQSGGDNQGAIDALTANLVETQLDLARRVLEDKDYKGAVQQATRILKLDPNNPEALGIREQAESASREIETSVKAARDAVSRGDSAQASMALERVLALDPRNPVIAELSSQLNENFAARATVAKSDMDKARSAAEAKEGAAQDPAFAEGVKFAEAAALSLQDRQFTAATQTFRQARDAYDRARRAIEAKERDEARAAKAAADAAIAAAKAAATPVPVAAASALPTINLRPLPSATPEPILPTPAPTLAIAPTPPPRPTVAAPAPELREFVTARTRVAAAPNPSAKQPKGFDMSGVALLEFAGRFEFDVLPRPLVPGGPFQVRVFLSNTGKNDARLDTLSVKVAQNGAVSTLPARILEDNVKAGQRPLIAEIAGTWEAGTRSWVMDVEAMSRKGERFRCSLTMKQP